MERELEREGGEHEEARSYQDRSEQEMSHSEHQSEEPEARRDPGA